MTAIQINADELRRILEKTEKALIVGHVKPDGDDVGSVLALAEALKNRGADTDMLIADEIAPKYKFLYLADEIKSDISEKKYDTLFFVDLSTMDRAGDIDWPEVPIVNIDHHISNPGFADYLYLDSTAAATGEILAALFLEWAWKITPTMAQSLYTAIATDCGFFRYENTSENTLIMASKMRALGARPDIISQQMESLPKAALTVLPQIMETLSFAAENRISYIMMNEAAMNAGGDYVDTYLDLARNIEGVELTLQFKYAEPKKTFVSFRSKQYIDVSKLASEFGGGGHIRAAGCTVYEDLTATVQKVIAIAEKWI